MRWITMILLLVALPVAAQDDGESEIEVGGEPDPADAPDPDRKPLNRERIPARASDAKIEWVAVKSANKLVTVHVPSDWRLREVSGKEDFVSFEAMAPGARVPGTIDVRFTPGQMPPLSILRFQIDDARKRDERAYLLAEPRPHVRVDRSDAEEPRSMLCLALRIRGNEFVLRMDAIRGDYDCFARDMFGIADRLETSRPDWPVIPENYKARKKGAFVYAVHPSAGKSLKDLQKIAARTEKWFTKFHGKPPRDAVTPVLFLHQGHGQGVALYSALEESKDVGRGDFSGQRAFFREFNAGSNDERAMVARVIADLCYERRYGLVDPAWARRATTEVAAMIEYGNLKPPKVHAGYRGWLETTSIPSLRDLHRVGREDRKEEWGRQVTFYGLFLHYGPSKYRNAFKKFLEACAETGDPDAALGKHLEPVGYDKLRDECDRYRRSKAEYVAPK